MFLRFCALFLILALAPSPARTFTMKNNKDEIRNAAVDGARNPGATSATPAAARRPLCGAASSSSQHDSAPTAQEQSQQQQKKQQILRPTLKGVVFQLEETLLQSSTIAEEQLQFRPGCLELLAWCAYQNIPMALLTNHNATVTEAFCARLQQTVEERASTFPDVSFQRIITRDADENPHSSSWADSPVLQELAKDCFDCTSSELLFVTGNSSSASTFVTEDSADNKNEVTVVRVGTDIEKTKIAVLTPPTTNTGQIVEAEDPNNNNSNTTSDLHIHSLTQLPQRVWQHYTIPGPLGNAPDNQYGHFTGQAPPTPQSELCMAVVYSDVPRVKVLLVNLPLERVTAPDPNGNTALIWAAEMGNIDLIQLLLDDVVTKARTVNNSTTTRQAQLISTYQNHRGYLGATALNRAARRNHVTALAVLLHRDGDTTALEIPNTKLQYPLHFAAFKQQREAVEYLLQCGANPWVLDRKGRTPLEDTQCPHCQTLLRAAMAS